MDAESPDATDPFACGHATGENQVPLFGGAFEIVADGDDAAVIRWLPAADETPSAGMRYRVYSSTTSMSYEFAEPIAEVQGVTSHRVTGLPAETRLYFNVRSVDEFGVSDCNLAEVMITLTGPPACVEYETDIDPIFSRRCTGCHGPIAGSQDLSLSSYEGTIFGGLTRLAVVACHPELSLLYEKISQDEPSVGRRMPMGGTPLPQAQIDLIGRWITEGGRASCSEPNPCVDTFPPIFAGAASATETSSISAEICWEPGADDLTPSARLIFDLFEGPAGAIDLDEPVASSRPGETCIYRDGYAGPVCWVVRARDIAGNADDNTVEQCP